MLRWLLGGLLGLIGLVAVAGVGCYVLLKRDDIPYETLESQYTSPASQFVDLPGGIHMHYREQGQDAQSPTVLLVHGFSASLHTWEPWVERLSEDYHVVSLDLPGHGLTRAPAGYQASIEAYSDAVHDFAAARGLTRFVLVGNSMGGNIAWQYARAYPDQVAGLILVDASGWEDTRAEAQTEPSVFKLLRNPTLAPLLRDLDNTQLTRQGLEAAFYDPSLVTDDMVERYSRLSRAPGHRDILLQITLGFRAREYATAERLAELHMPVLIMTGDTDRLVPPDHAQQFHDAIPGSQLIVFPQTGHIPQEERADDSAEAAKEFLFAVFEGSALAPGAE